MLRGRGVCGGVGGGGGAARDNITSIILPAEDILKGVKQAPEAKGDGEKKEEPKKEEPKVDARALGKSRLSKARK